MSETIGQFQTHQQVPLSAISEKYAQLRLIDKKAEDLMRKSIHKYGQISPAVAGQSSDGKYEIIDGFKRFRACRQLGHSKIKITVFKAGQRALKAAIISLNWKAKSIMDLEEAMVIRSLCSEDSLNQSEVAILLGRHKSWVSRRVTLAERLNDEIINDIRLGLINGTVARELAKLPRCNQIAALESVLEYSMTSRETSCLVSILLEEPEWKHESILRSPEEILQNRSPPRPRRKKDKKENILDKMTIADRYLKSLAELMDEKFIINLKEKDRDLILSIFHRIEQSTIQIKTKLHQHEF